MCKMIVGTLKTVFFALCFNVTNVSIFEFSTIIFHFIDANSNGIVDFVPKNYMYLYQEPKFYCFIILLTSNIRLTLNIISNFPKTIKWLLTKYDTKSTSSQRIDEKSCWPTSENTQKPLWQEEKTHPLGNSHDKIILSMSSCATPSVHDEDTIEGK